MKCKKRILLLALLLFSTVLIGGMKVQAKKTTKPTTLKKAKITLAKSSYTYNGKAKKPAVTVKLGKKKLKKNRDYTVKYTKIKMPERRKLQLKLRRLKREKKPNIRAAKAKLLR